MLTGLLWLLCLASTFAAPTRVALVGSERGAEVENVLALAQARLSADSGIELLERTEIRRLLDEQKLALFGVADATQAVTVGKLLPIDLFAVVESQPRNGVALGFVVFDVRSGARYWDAALPAGATAAADTVGAGVRSAVEKQHQPGLRTFGLLTVRNADLPRSQDGVCESVGLLFERGLPRSPGMAVLERRRLEHVNQERTFPGAAPLPDLLASMVTVDLEVGRGTDAGLKATAFLAEGGVKNPRRISVQIGEVNAPQLAETLLQKLFEELAVAPAPTSSDREAEAQRFDREADHHYGHDEFAAAVRAAEAATALAPANEKYAARLSLYLVRYATWLFNPTEMNSTRGGADAWADARVETLVLESLLGRATRGVEISAELLRRGLRDMWGHLVAFDHPMERLCDRLRGLRINATSADRQLIDSFLDLCRGRSVDFVERVGAKAESDRGEFDHYAAVFQSQCSSVKASCIDTAQYAETMHRLTARWLAVTKEWPPASSKWNGAESFNMLLGAIVNEGGYARWPWPVEESAYARRMEPLFALMRQHSRPSVRLYGLMGQIRADLALGRVSENETQARFAKEYRPLAQSIIIAPEPWHARRTREEVYEGWRAAIADFPGRDASRFMADEFTQLASFLMSRNELRSKVVDSILEALGPAAALEMAGRISAIVDSATLDDPGVRNTIRSKLNTVEQKILAEHPELASTRAGVPWLQATKIFDIANLAPLTEAVRPIIAGEVVYSFGFECEDNRTALRLIRIPLRESRAELLGRLDLGRPPKSLSSWDRNRFVPSACVDDRAVYAATRDAGIIAFPLDGSAPRTVDAGLPGNSVSAIACLDGKLYAGGDGYLVSCGLDASRCEIIASSRRKEKLSPFDDQAPFPVPLILADPERRRVVFIIGKGLWQLTPADGRIAQLLDLHAIQTDRSEPKLDGSSLTFSTPVRDNRVLLSTPFRAIEIDLGKDTATVIHHANQGVFQMWPPHLLVNDSLWSTDYFASLSLTARKQTRFPPFTGSTVLFRPSQCLVLVGSGRQVLAGDERTLWLLDLKVAVTEHSDQ